MKTTILLLLLGVITAFEPRFLSTKSDKMYVGYLQSWSIKSSKTGIDAGIANLPAYANVVNIAGMNPDGQYPGDFDLSKTGLEFSSNGTVIKASIDALKKKNPDTKILITVGGNNWPGLREHDIVHLVKDFGLDGIDIDYEPSNENCTSANGEVSCPTDAEYIEIVTRIRTALPRPYFLSIAAWSVGAYGQGKYQNSQPQSIYTGMAVNLLASEAAKDLDWINIMGYDAGNTYNPKEAFQAYTSLFSGKVVLGIEISPQAWGGHKVSTMEVDDLCDFINENEGAGMMIWSLNKNPPGRPSNTNPGATMISQHICKKFGLKDCNASLPN